MTKGVIPGFKEVKDKDKKTLIDMIVTACYY